MVGYNVHNALTSSAFRNRRYIKVEPGCHTDARFYNKHEVKFVLEDRGFTPHLHKAHNASVPFRSDVIEMIVCSCGQTKWAFNNLSVKNRQGISNHKGRYSYPYKFTY
jgi:hypothetical protein